MKATGIARGLTIAAMILLSALLFAEGGTATMSIKVGGFESDSGKLMVAVYDNEDAYKAGKPRVKEAVLPISGRKAEVSFDGIPTGLYAVSVFHDENGNGKIDTNFIGIPKEAYGYSNNARGKKGPPKFADIAVTLKEGSNDIQITVK